MAHPYSFYLNCEKLKKASIDIPAYPDFSWIQSKPIIILDIIPDSITVHMQHLRPSSSKLTDNPHTQARIGYISTSENRWLYETTITGPVIVEH